jgi:hypothetical protein
MSRRVSGVRLATCWWLYRFTATRSISPIASNRFCPRRVLQVAGDISPFRVGPPTNAQSGGRVEQTANRFSASRTTGSAQKAGCSSAIYRTALREPLAPGLSCVAQRTCSPRGSLGATRLGGGTGHAQHITDALDSAERSNYRDFEIMVIDDGSRDGSAEVVLEWTRAHDHIDPSGEHPVNGNLAPPVTWRSTLCEASIASSLLQTTRSTRTVSRPSLFSWTQILISP